MKKSIAILVFLVLCITIPPILVNAEYTVKPTITTQPKDVSVTAGSTATFKITASGASGYQWYYQKPGDATWNTVKNNGTSATYTLTAAMRHNGYKYRCMAKNQAGFVYSNKVTLTVNAKPTITAQPQNVTVTEGSKATFKVTASGAASYQWYYQKPGESLWNTVKNNGTSATYTFTAALRHNGYRYRCLLKNAAGSVYTSIAKLTVNPCPTLPPIEKPESTYAPVPTAIATIPPTPSISVQPKSVTVTEGSKATFKVTASGAASYQWYYQKPGESLWNTVKNNGTSATYTFTAALRHNGYRYRCLLKNAAGSVYTSIAKLTVNPCPTLPPIEKPETTYAPVPTAIATIPPTPSISVQPKSVTVTEGSKATFKVTASGAASYQWYYQKPGESTWNAVKNNGTSATYTLTAAMRHNGYKYRCQLKNTTGSVYTSVVTLRVYPCPTLPPIEKPETTYAPVPTAIATIPPKP